MIEAKENAITNKMKLLGNKKTTKENNRYKSVYISVFT